MSEFQFVGNLADMVPGQDDGEGFQYQGVLVPPKLKGKTKEFSLDELDGFDPGKDHPWQFTFKTGEKVGELPTDEQNALDLEKRAAAGRAWATRKYEEYKHEAMSELERPGSGSQNFNRLLWANKNALPFGRAIAKFGEGVVSGDLRKQFEENPHMMDENSIAALADLDAREEYNRPKTIMQSIGQGVAALPAFATEIALGAGIGGRASTVAKAGLRGQVASPIAREAIGMAASAAANPATAVAGLSSAGDRAAAGERLDSALTKGFIDGYIEVLSEGVGGMKAVQHAQSLLASRFGKVLPAKVAENLAAWYDKSRLKDLAKATQQHGFVGELGEERAGELMRMATTAIPGAELGTLEETGGITYDVPTGAFNLATGNTAEARRHFGEAAKQAAIEAGVIGAPVALRLAAGIGQRPDAPNAPQSPQIAPPGQPGLTPVQPPPIAPAGQLEAQEPAPEPQAPGGQAFDAVRKIFADGARDAGERAAKVPALKELAATEGFPESLKGLIDGLPESPSRKQWSTVSAEAQLGFDDTAQPAPVFDTLKETALDPQAEPEVVRDVAAAAVNDAGTPDAVAEAIARDQQEGTPESLQGLRDAIAQSAPPVQPAAVQEAPAASSPPIISGATRVAVGGQQAQSSTGFVPTAEWQDIPADLDQRSLATESISLERRSKPGNSSVTQVRLAPTESQTAQQPDPNVSEAGATVVEPTERKDQTSEKDQAEVGQGGLQGPLVRPTQESATTDQTPQPTAVAQPSPGEAMNRAAVPVVEQPQPQEPTTSEAPTTEPSQEVVPTPPPQAEPTPSVETQPKSPRQKAKEKATSDIRKQLPDMLRAANDEVGRKGGKKLTEAQMKVVLDTLYAWEEAYLVPQGKNLGNVIGEDFFKGQLDDNGEWLYQTEAYTGSPAKFDRHSTEHIGSGEGGAAYGWGLYFSSLKKIADHYRHAFAPLEATFAVNGKALNTKLDVRQDYTPEYEQARISLRKELEAATGMRITMTATDAIIEAAGEHGHHMRQNVSDLANEAASIILHTEGPGDAVNELKAISRKAKISGKLKRGGATYKVTLAPAEDEYLLWDKPLSEQSEKVKAALSNAGFNATSNSSYISELEAEKNEAYDLEDKVRSLWFAGYFKIIDSGFVTHRIDDRDHDAFQGVFLGSPVGEEFDSHEHALQEVIREASRNSSRKRNKLADAKANNGGDVYWALERRFIRERVGSGYDTFPIPGRSVEDMKSASIYLRSLGIRGVKYIGERAKTGGEGAYNYVIFDEADVEHQVVYYQTDHTIRRAAVRLLTGGRAIMAVGKDTNFTSYMHELAHVMSQWLTEGADREIANEYVGAKPGTNPRDWDVPQQEKWAKGFESAMTDNKPQPRKESMSNAEWKFWGLMRRIRDAMMEVYGKVFSGLSADDKPKGAVMELYRRLLGQEQAKVKDATKFRDQWVAKNQKIVGGQQAAEERKQAAETGQDTSGRKVMTRAEFDAALTTEFYNELNKLAAGLKKRVDAYRGMDTDEMVSNAVDKVLEENLFTEFDPAAGKTLAQWLMSKTYPDRMEKGQVSQDQARQEKSRKGRVSKKDLDDNPDEVLFARGDEYQPTTRNLGMAPTGITPVTAKDVRDFITKLFDGMPILIKRNLAYGAYGLYKARAQITKLTKNTSANMGVLFHELGHHLRFTTDIMNALTGLDGATARDIIDKYRKSNRTDKDRRATKARLMRLRASPATIAAIEANDPNMADIATAQQFGVMSAEQKAALKELKALDYDVVNGKKTADKGSPEEGLTELLRRMLINKEDMSQTAPNATRLYNRWKKDVPPEVSQKIDAVVEKIGQFVGPNPIERYKKAMGSPRTLLEKTSDALARASRHPTWLADRDVPAREIEDIARKNGMNKDGDPNWVWLSDSLQATRGLAQTLADDDLNGGVSYSPLSESGHMPGDPIQTGGFRTELHNTALTPDQHKEMLVLWWARITVWFDDNVNENRRHENAKKVAQWQIDKKAAIAAGLEPPPKPRLIAEYETGMEVDEARAIVDEIETNRPQELVAAYHSLQHKAQETLRALLVKSVDAGVMDAGHARKAMEQGMYLPLVRNIQEAFSFVAGGGPLDGRGRLKRRTESGSDAGVKNFLEQIYRQVYETNQAIINKMNMDALAGTIDTMQGAPDGMGWLAYRMDKNELYDHIRTQLKNSWKEIAEQAAKYGVSLQSIEEFSDNDALLQAFISIKFLNDKPSSEKGIMIRRETRYYDSNRGEWVDLPKSRLVGYQFVDKDFLQWWLSLSPKEWEWYHQLLATPSKLIKSGVQMFSPGFIGAAPLHDMALGHERERTPQQWSAWEAYGKIPFLSRALRWGRNMQRTVRSTYHYHRTGEHLDEAEELFMRYVGRVTPQAGSTRNPSHAIHYDIEQSNRAAMRNMSMLDRITASLNSLRNGLTPTNWSLEGAIEGVFSAGEKAMWKLSSVHDLVSEYTGLMDTAERKSEFIGSLDRDGFSLNSDGKFVDRSTGRESSPPWPVLSRAINAAKRVTGDFSAASDELRAVDNFAIPYIAAAATTQYQIWNMRSGRGKAISDMVDAVLGRKKLTPEAAKLASKAMMVMIGGTVMGAMYAAMMRQWRPKEYLAEDPGSLYATFRDSKGDPSGRTRIPRSWFLFFATGQSLVDLYYGDEDRAMRRMWASAKQESPAGNISVPALTVVEAVGDRKLDWDSGRSIQGEYLRKTEHPYRRIKHDTTPVSKWIAENFRIGNWSFAPPAMDHVANEWTGGAYGNIQAAAGYTYGSARNLVQGRSPYGNGGWTIQNTPLGVYFPSKDYFESKRLLTEDYVLNIARDINAKKAEGGDVTVLEQKKVRADFAVLVVQELEKASIAETDKQAREVYRKAIAGVSQWGMGQDADDRTMDNPLNGAESWPPAIQDIVTDRLKSLVYSATEALSTESKEKTSRLDDTIQHRRAIVKRLLSEDKIRWYLQQELTDKRNGGKEFKRETYINRITRLGIDPWPKAN